jgi:transcriptional regulator with XRE-family HTH domain
MSRYPDDALITREQAEAAAPRLRKARAARGWSQGQLSIASGVGVSTIAHAEMARARLQIVNAEALAGALGMSLADLTGDSLAAAEYGERA